MIKISDIFGENESENTRQLEYGLSLVDDINRWVSDFINNLKLLSRSNNTITSYKFTLNALVEYSNIYLNDKKGLCDIKVEDCNSFLSWMEDYSVSRRYGSIKERIVSLAEFLEYAKNNKGDFIELSEKYLQNNIANKERADFIISHFEDYYYKNEVPFEKIDNHYIVKYIESIPKSSVATMANRRAVLHKFFTYIAEETETDCFKDIFRKLKRYRKQKGSPQNRNKKLDSEIMAKFLELLDRYIEDPRIIQKRKRKNSERVAYRDAAMIILMYRGGLRASEALNIRLCDITKTQKTYKIDVIAGKGNKNRTTYIKREYFEKYYVYFSREIQSSAYLSATSNNKKLDRRILYAKVKKIFQKLKQDGEIEKDVSGLHIFRHLFGSEFAEKDGNMKILQDLLGHSVITTTMIYSGVGEKAKEDAAFFV